jgi:hypothetical protein
MPPFPPPGPSGLVPRHLRYYEGTKTSPLSSRQSRSSTTDSISPESLRAGLQSRGHLYSATLQCGLFSEMEHGRSPRFLYNPLRICPVLRPRPSRSPRLLRVFGIVLLIRTKKTPAKIHLSRLIRTAFAITVYASHYGHPHAQDSLPISCRDLSGGVGYPLGCSREFQTRLSSLLYRFILAPSYTCFPSLFQFYFSVPIRAHLPHP